MLVLGVTGGIGTGKTTVSSLFRGLGAELIDADEIAHELLRPGGEGANRVRELFGEAFIDDQGGVRRQALGRVVFTDPDRRKALEGALHPLITGIIEQRLADLRRRPDSHRLVVVLDAPVLFEAGAQDLVDRVVVVWASRSTQTARLLATGRMTEDEIDARIASQMPLEEKAELADFVVDNDGELENTKRQVAEIWSRVRAARAGDGGP